MYSPHLNHNQIVQVADYKGFFILRRILMGFASATNIMTVLIKSLIERGVSSMDTRKTIYQDVGEELFDMDWDTADECVGIDEAYDEAYKEWYPSEEGED